MVWVKSNAAGRQILRIFLTLFSLLIFMGVVSTCGVNRIKKDFFKAYTERIIPALDIAHVIEKQSDNRFHLEECITGISIEDRSELARDIKLNNRRIDSITNHYLKSHNFSEAERAHLRSYLDAIGDYRKIEKSLIELAQSGQTDSAATLFKTESYRAYAKAMEPLDLLVVDQVEMGKQLYNEASDVATMTQTILYLCLAFALFLGVVLSIRLSLKYMND